MKGRSATGRGPRAVAHLVVVTRAAAEATSAAGWDGTHVFAKGTAGAPFNGTSASHREREPHRLVPRATCSTKRPCLGGDSVTCDGAGPQRPGGWMFDSAAFNQDIGRGTRTRIARPGHRRVGHRCHEHAATRTSVIVGGGLQ